MLKFLVSTFIFGGTFLVLGLTENVMGGIAYFIISLFLTFLLLPSIYRFFRWLGFEIKTIEKEPDKRYESTIKKSDLLDEFEEDMPMKYSMRFNNLEGNLYYTDDND